MSIKRLSNNKYRIVIELGYDILGNRKRKTLTFNGTKEDATKEEAKLRQKYYHVGNTTKICDLTFKEYSQIFLDKYCKNNISLITMDGYEKSLKRILPLIGNIKLNKITPLILDNMYNELRNGKTKQLGYHSMYSFKKLINVMFNQAIKWEIIDKNPNDKTTKLVREKKERRYYDLDQVDKLLSCLENENIKYRTLINLALDSGARRGEICALRWSDIDFEKGTMNINKSLKVVRGIVDEAKPKTDSSNRTIELTSQTLELLQSYKNWQNNYIEWVGKKWQGTDRVFTDIYGKHIHPSSCDHIMRKIVKKYDLDPICFHELRHTSASMLITKGLNPKAVSQRLGHADTSITMEIYTHTFDKTKKECVMALEEVFKGHKSA